ncbi:MAG TPA: PD-(D/E)XK nuclease family protein, partial [Polyangiaceae bacterium]|nr:PD-(D/E)XK nuclease family protein [Polyangiaceae bacterium]
LATVARGLLGGLSDSTLASLCEAGRGLKPASRWLVDVIAEPEQRQAATLLRERIADFGRVAPRLSPRAALAFAIELFELESVLAALPRGQVRFGNVLRLLEIATRHGGGLATFTRWLEEQINIDADESEAAVFSQEDDAVRLVTIHGSKGLAFPIVVLLDIGAVEQPRSFPISLLREPPTAPKLVVRQRAASGSLHNPLQRAAYEDAARRAAAERQRLAYVALTRAERELVLIVPPAPAKPQSLAHTLQELDADGSLPTIDGFRRLRTRELLARAPLALEGSGETPPPPPHRPQQAAVSTLAVGATALADFALCERRFELIHVLGLDEPALAGSANFEPASDDPRSLGSAAHRLLERWPLERWGQPTRADLLIAELEQEGLSAASASTLELAAGVARFLSGPFAAQVRGARRVYRELELSTLFRVAPNLAARTLARSGKRTRRASENPSQLDLFASTPDEAAPDGMRVLLKTTLDLLVEHDDGSFDIVDYKRSTGRFAERYALQLAAYRSAVERHYRASRVRTGLVHLLAESPEPTWAEPVGLDVARLATELSSARWAERFLAVEKPRCQRVGCGFIATCHRTPAAPRNTLPSTPATEPNQVS